ncbi:MAG: hypothetical protein ACRYG4_13980, partial [Janthinobacterium lividum]
HITVTLSLAALMWVVPSVGTQGMGTIGRRLTHPDRDLVGRPVADIRSVERADSILQNADRTVETALGF